MVLAGVFSALVFWMRAKKIGVESRARQEAAQLLLLQAYAEAAKRKAGGVQNPAVAEPPPAGPATPVKPGGADEAVEAVRPAEPAVSEPHQIVFPSYRRKGN